MLDLHRTDTARVREAISKSPADLDRLLALDEERRARLAKVEALKHERNEASEEIGRRKKAGEDAAASIAAMKRVGDEIKSLDGQIAELESEIERILIWIPNLPHESVPRAADASGNVVVASVGEPRRFAFQPKPHWDLAESLGLLDFERGVKIAGSGFLLFTGPGARLERALIQFMLDLHTKKHGYREVSPPHVVLRECLFGTGQLPKLEEEMYRLADEELFLNPTAEVPVTNMYRDEILEGERLPIYHTAYCASYRREAGAAGRETRGMVRVHHRQGRAGQIVRPETRTMNWSACGKMPGRPRRARASVHRVPLAAGDLTRQREVLRHEAWRRGRWLEVSSCSSSRTFKRRAGIVSGRAGRRPGSCTP
jgi:seryl-tRNA synthetase